MAGWVCEQAIVASIGAFNILPLADCDAKPQKRQ
jgi:hypothetical protein